MTLPLCYVPDPYGYSDAELATAIANEPTALHVYQVNPEFGHNMVRGDFPDGEWTQQPGSEFAWTRWATTNLAVANGYSRNRLGVRYRFDRISGFPTQEPDEMIPMVAYGRKADVPPESSRYSLVDTGVENWDYPGSIAYGADPRKWLEATVAADGQDSFDRWDYYWNHLRLHNLDLYPCKYDYGSGGTSVLLHPIRSWWRVRNELVRLMSINSFHWLVLSGNKFVDLRDAQPPPDFTEDDVKWAVASLLVSLRNKLVRTGLNLKVVVIAQDGGTTSEWIESRIPDAASWIYDHTADTAYDSVVLERNARDGQN